MEDVTGSWPASGGRWSLQLFSTDFYLFEDFKLDLHSSTDMEDLETFRVDERELF